MSETATVKPSKSGGYVPSFVTDNVAPWAILALGILAPFFLASYDLNLLSRFLSYGILAMGLVMIWGHTGILSLGQGAFFGLGGYAVAMHMKLASAGGQLPDFMFWMGRESLPWWWAPFSNPVFAVVAIFILPALIAGLFAWSVFHRRVGGVYFALISQALALAFATLLVSRQDVTGGFNGLTDFRELFGLQLGTDNATNILYWVTLGLVVLTFFAAKWILSSQFGTMLRAVRDGENRMRFLGFSPSWFKIAAFAFAGMLAGVSGALFTVHAGVVSPAMVGVIPSIEMVIWVAIGGRFSLSGALFAAVAVNFARDSISSAFPTLWLYFIGALFIVVVTLLPKGLAGLFERETRQ